MFKAIKNFLGKFKEKINRRKEEEIEQCLDDHENGKSNIIEVIGVI